MITEVEKTIFEVVSHIKELCPEAVVHISREQRYENEDAILTIYTPRELPDEIFDAIYRKTWEVEMERGMDIVVHVREGESVPVTA